MKSADLQAVIFDFDGLLADTEQPEFEAWQRIYETLGHKLTHEVWARAVGYASVFDPKADLEERTGRQLDWTALDEQRRQEKERLMEQLSALPGAAELVEWFSEQGVPIGCASNSHRQWVERGLNRIGLQSYFRVIIGLGDSEAPKPDPAPYRAVLKALNAEAARSLAFEDSGPGLHSSTAAGIYTIVVPGPITRHQDLSRASEQLESLEDFRPEVTLPRLARRHPPVPPTAA